MKLQHLAALCALAILTIAAPAAAGVKDQVFNKEGVWGIDVDHGSCAASMILADGSTFLLRGTDGQVNVAWFARAKVAHGKTARIETEAYGFDFKPGWADPGVYTGAYIDARAIAALRPARQVRILVDGRPVVAVTLEGTGFEQALDGLIACSKGESGWWGPGVGVVAPAADVSKPVLNKEGVWAIVVGDPGTCFVQAGIGNGSLQFPAAAGVVGVAVASETDLPRGRRGRIETDSLQVDFKPYYAGRRYLASDDPLASDAIAALRDAKWIRVTVDGRAVADAQVEGTGLADALDAVAACSRSERGWWGEGAKAR